MKIEVFLTASPVQEEHVKNRTVVVIDVLRACSTIAAALSNGARAIVPVSGMEQGDKIASNLDHQSYLLGGERGGLKIEGYHLGNSPLEYVPEKVSEKIVIFNTTNGTAAIQRTRAAKRLLTGCFLNVGRIVEYIRQAGNNLTIVCAGWRNRISFEDMLCAGLMLYRLWDGKEPARVTDVAHIAFSQYVHHQDDLMTVLRWSNHARRLVSHGFEADLDYCFRLDALPVLPYYQGSRLVLHK